MNHDQGFSLESPEISSSIIPEPTRMMPACQGKVSIRDFRYCCRFAGRRWSERHRPWDRSLALRCFQNYHSTFRTAPGRRLSPNLIAKNIGVPHEGKLDFQDRNGFAILVRTVLTEGDRGLENPCRLFDVVEYGAVVLITELPQNRGPSTPLPSTAGIGYQANDLEWYSSSPTIASSSSILRSAVVLRPVPPW